MSQLIEQAGILESTIISREMLVAPLV